MTVLGLDHVQVSMPAGGEEQARAFYGALLGLEELPKPTKLAARGGAWFRCGALQLHLGVETDFSPARKAHPALIVQDLTALSQRMRAAGYPVRADHEIPDVTRAFSADPFGNRIELIQHTTAVTERR